MAEQVVNRAFEVSLKGETISKEELHAKLRHEDSKKTGQVTLRAALAAMAAVGVSEDSLNTLFNAPYDRDASIRTKQIKLDEIKVTYADVLSPQREEPTRGPGEAHMADASTTVSKSDHRFFNVGEWKAEKREQSRLKGIAQELKERSEARDNNTQALTAAVLRCHRKDHESPHQQSQAAQLSDKMSETSGESSTPAPVCFKVVWNPSAGVTCQVAEEEFRAEVEKHNLRVSDSQKLEPDSKHMNSKQHYKWKFVEGFSGDGAQNMATVKAIKDAKYTHVKVRVKTFPTGTVQRSANSQGCKRYDRSRSRSPDPFVEAQRRSG